jgi:hypothetical protein
MTQLLSFMSYVSLCSFVNWIYEPHDPFDKGTFDILSWPQLQATTVQLDGVADSSINASPVRQELRLEFLLFQAK